MLGVARSILLASAGLSRPVLHLRLDESGGATAFDTKGLSSGTYHGTVEYHADPLFFDDGTSKGFNGTDTRVTIPHVPGLELASWTVTFLFQLRTGPTAGSNKVLFEKDNNGPGSTSLEIYNNAGTLRLRGYAGGASGFQWIGSNAGFGAIDIGRAYRCTATVGNDGAKLYLTDDAGLTELLAEQFGATTGWGSNADITFGSWKTAATAFVDGFLDDLRIYRHALTQAEIEGLPRPATISPATVQEYITSPEAHGWADGNTVAANTAAFQAAVNNASAKAHVSSTGLGVVQLQPGKLYVVRGNSGGLTNFNGCLLLEGTGQSNVWIRTLGQPTGATRATVQLSSSVNVSGVNQLCVFALKSRNTTHVKLSHLIVDGNKWGLTIANVNHNTGDNGGLHCIGIAGAWGVHLERVEAKNGFTDGLCIRRWETGTGDRRPKNIHAVDCDFHHNRRQGMSIIQAGDSVLTWDQLTFTRCKFRETGDETGYLGQRPAAGVDMEPDGQTHRLHGISFYDCEFTNNQGGTYESGALAFRAGGRGWVADIGTNNLGSEMHHCKLINCVESGNFNPSSAFAIICRQNGQSAPGNYSIVTNFLAQGNVMAPGSRFYIQGFPTQTSTTRFSILESQVKWQNNIMDTIAFETLRPTGHDIHLTGNVKTSGGTTTVNTNGHHTITVS